MIASSAHETVGKFRFSIEIPQLRPFSHLVDQLAEVEGLLTSVGVRLWNRVRVDLLH